MSKEIIQVRTNTNLSVVYADNSVKPQIEVIILHGEPKYQLKKDKIIKELGIAESRFMLSPEALNLLINELQLTAKSLAKYSQLAEQINVIDASTQQP
jgi:hypothetical protein